MSTEIDEILLNKKCSKHWEILLNRPSKLNSFTLTMYQRFIEILQEGKQDENLIILSVRGVGKYFSSGADLTSPLKISSTDRTIDEQLNFAADLLKRFIDELIEFPKILLGFVNGPSIGIGVTMLLLFDGVYGSTSSTYELPFTRTGQSPECCSSWTIIHQMGFVCGKEFLLFNRQLNSSEALQRGLINRILPDEQFDQIRENIIETILSLPKQSLLSSKEIIQKHFRKHFHQINDDELNLLRTRWTSEEFIQRIFQFSQRKISSNL